MDFHREASSLENAVITAINNVESSPLNTQVIRILPDNLVSETEIAARLNKSRQTISLWVKKQRRQTTHFPNPIAGLSDKSPLWCWHDVVNWLFQQQLIKDARLVDSAKFINNINAVLGERDQSIQQYRQHILSQLPNNVRNGKRNIMGNAKR